MLFPTGEHSFQEQHVIKDRRHNAYYNVYDYDLDTWTISTYWKTDVNIFQQVQFWLGTVFLDWHCSRLVPVVLEVQYSGSMYCQVLMCMKCERSLLKMGMVPVQNPTSAFEWVGVVPRRRLFSLSLCLQKLTDIVTFAPSPSKLILSAIWILWSIVVMVWIFHRDSLEFLELVAKGAPYSPTEQGTSSRRGFTCSTRMGTPCASRSRRPVEVAASQWVISPHTLLYIYKYIYNMEWSILQGTSSDFVSLAS